MKKLGQHFLINEEIIKRIAASLAPQKDETIIEIGPGHGELTEELGARCKVLGARLVAIEKDTELAISLKKKFKNNPCVEIVEGDALRILPTLTSNLSPQTFSIVGNIPYYITGHLIRIIGELSTKPRATILMIQEEVAERLIALPPKMNRLAASVQWWASPKLLFSVNRKEFSPSPEVDSAVISLLPAKKPAELKDKDYYRAVRVLFAQPRKTILNNVTASDGLSKEKALEVLRVANIDPKERPQNLSIAQIAAIAQKLAMRT